MDLETTKQSKLSQREIKKLHNIAYMWNIKNIYTDELICKTEIETQMQISNIWILRREGEGGMNWEIRINIYTLLCIKHN